MAASDSFADVLRERMSPLRPAMARPMLGEAGVSRGGAAPAMARDEAPSFRVDGGARAVFAEVAALPLGDCARGDSERPGPRRAPRPAAL